MKRTLLTLLAASSLVAAVPMVAQAQSWMTMSQRQAQLDQRIDVGVRNGQLTAPEAAGLRADFDGLVRLEGDYRRSAPGLTQGELQDLDHRFDALSARIHDERADNDRYGNRGDRANNYEDQRAQIERQIDQGLRSGQLSRAEADDLRRQAVALDRLQDQYRASERRLSRSERADLDRRYDQLAENLRIARSDRDRQWDNMQTLRVQLDRRIDRAQRDNRVSYGEASRLHNDSAALVRLEAQYRATAPGVTRTERADLDRRIDVIERRIGDNVNLSYGYGYGVR